MGNQCADPGALPKRPALTIPLGPHPCKGRLARRLPYRIHRERVRWPTKKGRLQSLILPEPAAGQKKAVGI